MSEKKELRWKTYNHLLHPYGDLIWHLFWGVMIGGLVVKAIISSSFWLLIVSLIALIFFFHPSFYKPELLDIKLTEKGLYINEKFYPWNKFWAFEIFDNNLRKYIFFFPHHLSFGLHVPLEEFFVTEEEVREFLKNFLEEQQGKVPFLDRLYRAFFL